MVLIVYAHPGTKGHCSAILNEVVSSLKSKNIKYDLIDLYKIKYDPVLHKEELYTAGNYNISKQNKDFQSKIKNNDKFVFIAPVWWNDVPPILKGFFDKVFTPRFAYLYEGGRPKGLLKGKKAVTFLTTGAPGFLYWLLERNIASRIMKFYTLGFCGVKSKVFRVGSASKLNEKQLEKIKKQVKNGLSYLL